MQTLYSYNSLRIFQERLYMQVSPVSFASFGRINKNTPAAAAPANTAPKSNTGLYNLPGYNVSFGTLIKEYNKNPGVMLDSENKKTIQELSSRAIDWAGDCEGQDFQAMEDLLEKYKNNVAATRYFVRLGMEQKEKKDAIHYINSFVDTINKHFSDKPSKKKKHLDALISTKNKDGESIIHTYADGKNMISTGFLPHLLKSIENFPDLQIKVLRQENKNGYTLGNQLAMLSSSEDGQAINNTLYKLCAKTRLVSRKESIKLLEENMKILNQDNKEVLEALRSKDCICIEDEPQITSNIETAEENRTQQEHTPEQPAQKTVESQDKDANDADEELKSKPKEIEVPPFFNNGNKRTKEKISSSAQTHNARTNIGKGEYIIPDFLQNKNNKGSRAATGKDSAKATIAPTIKQTDDTNLKDEGVKEIQVMNFSKSRDTNSAELTSEIKDTKIQDFAAHKEQYTTKDTCPSINWGQQLQACDG